MSITSVFGPYGIFGYFAEQPTFNTATDVPDLSGKTVVITGGTNGLGRETVKVLAKKNPAQIILVARYYRAATTITRILEEFAPNVPVKWVECNLASLPEVAKAAKQIQSETSRIDYLFNNAGVMCTDAGTTKDGYENQFAVNFLSHALLTDLLMPTLIKTSQLPNADVRVIFTSTMGHFWMPTGGIRFDELKSEGKSDSSFTRYGQSKLAVNLWAHKLAQEHPEISFLCVHPGIVNTNLWTPLDRRSTLFNVFHSLVGPLQSMIGVQEPDEACKGLVWAASADKGTFKNGEFYTPIGAAGSGHSMGRNQELAQKLSEWTFQELKQYKA